MATNLKQKIAVWTLMFFAALSLPAKSNKFAAYLFTCFTGNTPEQEQIRYALSEDGWNYTMLNGGRPVIASDTVARKKALRDPHLLRGKDGYFYQVATDMASSEGWDSNRGIVMMRSKDLIKWEHHSVHFPQRFEGTPFAKVTRVWAPQTIFDEETGKYMVYFSLLTNDGTIPYDKVHFCYANDDFSNLEGEPQVLFDLKSACIDTDIVRDDGGIYHIFFKTEGLQQKGIKQFLAKSLHNSKEWTLRDEYCQDTDEAVEGSSVFRRHDGSWVLMYDCYMNGHYQFCKSNDLLSFTQVQNTKTSDAFKPRHGTVIAITNKEAELLRSWSLLNEGLNELCQQTESSPTTAKARQRDRAIRQIKATLDGTASIKSYKAQLRKLEKFFERET
ncbi:MAG: glycoside hydrolase family 43 protein [Bacteroidales bacterium]|nr:glycoside hydrolase family 43 protein [Candidatus Physcousia equi]